MIMRVRRFVVFVVIRGMGILYILLTVMEIYVVFHDQYVAQYTHTYIYIEVHCADPTTITRESKTGSAHVRCTACCCLSLSAQQQQNSSNNRLDDKKRRATAM